MKRLVFVLKIVGKIVQLLIIISSFLLFYYLKILIIKYVWIFNFSLKTRNLPKDLRSRLITIYKNSLPKTDFSLIKMFRKIK